MRAAIRTGLLGYTLTFKTDHPAPVFDKGGKNKNDVQINVKAAALNPVDYKLPRALNGEVYGKDVCGTVVQVGSNVASNNKLSVGDLVYGMSSTGALADQAIASADSVAKVSGAEHWTPAELAALPVAYLTALQGIRVGGIVPPEDGQEHHNKQSLLVIGASGGCGLAGVQLASCLGVSRIVAICSSKNVELVQSNGATEVVDYTDKLALDKFLQDNQGSFDCVYDAASGSGGGEDYLEKSMPLLKTQGGEAIGWYVALNGPASMWLRKLTGKERLNQKLILTDCNTSDLELILQLLSKKRLKPQLNEKPFTEKGVKEGYELLKSRRTRGKIVYKVDS